MCEENMIEMCDSVIPQDRPGQLFAKPIGMAECSDLCSALIACSSTASEIESNAPYHPDGAPMERLRKINEIAEDAIKTYNEALERDLNVKTKA